MKAAVAFLLLAMVACADGKNNTNSTPSPAPAPKPAPAPAPKPTPSPAPAPKPTPAPAPKPPAPAPAPKPPAPAPAPKPPAPKPTTMLEVATAACPSFVALASENKNSSVYKALTEVSKSKSKNSVFCPSEKAVKDAADALRFLEDKANDGALNEVLEYHVSTEFVNGTDELQDGSLPTLDSDDSITVKVSKDGNETVIMVNGFHVSGVGAAANGYVFMVEGVMLPNDIKKIIPSGDAASALAVAKDLSSVYGALKAFNLTDALKKSTATGLTVLAPSNEAMEAFAKTQNLIPDNSTHEYDFTKAIDMKERLQFHVITDIIYADQWKDMSVGTLDSNAGNISIKVTTNKTSKVTTVTAAGGKDTKAEIAVDSAIVTENAVIYIIDKVLAPSPPSGKEGLTTGAIVAIIIGSVAGLICIAALVYNFTKTRQEKMQDGYGALDA